MSIHATFYLAFAAAIGSGIVGGVFYAFSSFVMPALARIPAEQGIDAMKSINVVVINRSFMAVFMGTAILSVVLAGYSLIRPGSPGSAHALIGAALYLVGSIGVTMIFNVPMNNRLEAVDALRAANYWPDYIDTWTRWNHVRAAASTLASVLFIAALTLR
jgi:uncharacterized membrane protein